MVMAQASTDRPGSTEGPMPENHRVCQPALAIPYPRRETPAAKLVALNLRVPLSLRKRLKIAAAQEGVTMTAYTVAALLQSFGSQD
jgi:hypothetical protein